MNEGMALKIAGFLIILGFIHSQAALNPKTYDYEVREANFTRLCKNKTILTVNGEFPGPTIYARRGDTLVVNVYNKGNLGITIHWHGVKQPRTLWWHAHSDWSRATVHGLIVIWPKIGRPYPFPKPYVEYPIILGEWWWQDVEAVLLDFMKTGGDPNSSAALTVNGQPGDLYPCSSSGHEITVVGTDGAYTKPLKSHYGVISPGQTIDVLFKADQPIGQYYFAARPYNSQPNIDFDNTTTTAIFEYKGYKNSYSHPVFPHLPKVNDTGASVNFTGSFRSLASHAHPIDVPMKITRNFLYTISINTLPCPGNTCLGPRGLRFAASVNNITFDPKSISILNAYYGRINGVYGDDFPRFPPELFNFTSSNISRSLETPLNATEVQVLNYNDAVQLVIQGTNLVAGIDHPMHLHGHSFYVVGWGLGNYNKSRDPLNFNLIDPPLQQTIAVPKNGWTAIRFKADNPGVWLMHCHLERHISWGMETVFITKNGARAGESLLPPPPDMPPCI
ncbi:putative laccase [Tanacetum coccineum]